MEAVNQLGSDTAYVYEYSSALVNVAGAYAFLGEHSLAHDIRERGLALARRFGLTEVVNTARHVDAIFHRKLNVDTQLAGELEELRRTFTTIAAGVLGSGAEAEGKSITAPKRNRA